MDVALKNYFMLAKESENLRSTESRLQFFIANLEILKDVVARKEQEFLKLSSKKDYLSHLLHYRCIIECLSDEILQMENLISEDEFVSLSLLFRDAARTISVAINRDIENIESNWKMEHRERKLLVRRLVLDLEKLLKDKLRTSLSRQQEFLLSRYFIISNLCSIICPPARTAISQ